MATTRSNLRTQLQNMSSNQLTVQADQDFYLNLAELEVIGDWRKFDPGLFRAARTAGTTDAAGVMKVTAGFSKLERLEDANKVQYAFIDDLSQVWNKTGYYFQGYNTTDNVRTIQVMKNGAPLASASLFYFDIRLAQMASGDSAQPVFPDEYRTMIAMKGAHLYFRDQGPPFASFATFWATEYERKRANAEDWYKNVTSDPQYIESSDPDSGAGSRYIGHVVTT